VTNTTTNTAVCNPSLPTPILVYQGIEAFEALGQTWNKYLFSVANWSSYPDEMFGRYDTLPPVGRNADASRTFVDFYDADLRMRLSRNAKLSSASDLQSLFIVTLSTVAQPSSLYLLLTDRICTTTYQSENTLLAATSTPTSTPSNTPTFTPSSTPTPTPAVAWHFNTPGDMEGWAAIKDLTSVEVSGGALKGTASGVDPIFRSSPGLGVDASSVETVEVKMKVSAGTLADLFYISPTDARFTATKRKRFGIVGGGDWAVYTLDMSGDPNWTGIIGRLRFDPTTVPGAMVEIDYILMK